MRGQSTVEFAVGSASLVLLLLGMLVLSGFQEAQRRGILAARHAAFSDMWHNGRSGGPLTERMHGLHFDDAGYVRPAGDARWITPADVQVTSTQRPLPGAATTASEVLLRPLQAVGGFTGSGFDLRAGGYGTGEVTVHPRPHAALPSPFDTLELRLTHSMHLLGDGWNAAGPRHVEARTAGLVLTAPLADISAAWRRFAAPLALIEPGLDQLCLGLIEPDQVPEDRLGPAVQRPLQGECR